MVKIRVIEMEGEADELREIIGSEPAYAPTPPPALLPPQDEPTDDPEQEELEAARVEDDGLADPVEDAWQRGVEERNAKAAVPPKGQNRNPRHYCRECQASVVTNKHREHKRRLTEQHRDRPTP